MNKWITLKCPVCGNEGRHCPYTGYGYSDGWTAVCGLCGSSMEARYETPIVQRHECECEKVLKKKYSPCIHQNFCPYYEGATHG